MGNTRTAARKPTTSVGRLARFLVPASIALMLSTGGYYYAAKSKIDPRRSQLQQKDQALQAILNEADERQRIAERNAAIRSMTKQVAWSEIFRSLSFVIPETALIETVHFEKEGKPVLVIRGSIVGSLSRAQTDFNAFVGSLRRIPGIRGVRANNPPSETANGQTRIRFEVECELN